MCAQIVQQNFYIRMFIFHFLPRVAVSTSVEDTETLSVFSGPQEHVNLFALCLVWEEQDMERSLYTGS